MVPSWQYRNGCWIQRRVNALGWKPSRGSHWRLFSSCESSSIPSHPRQPTPPLIVQNPQQEVRMQNHECPATWQRNLRFEDDELWPKLPEPVRESCRALWKE